MRLSRTAAASIRVATVLERYPRVVPAMSSLEVAVTAMRDAVAVERSSLSQTEIEKTKKQPAPKPGSAAKKGKSDMTPAGNAKADAVFSKTSAAPPLPTTPVLPLTNLNRHLDEKLFLVVQRKGEDGWFVPTVALEDNDDLRSAAERALGDAIDLTATKTYFIGYGPSSCQIRGADKVFALRCVLVSREATFATAGPYQTHKWLTHAELAAHLDSSDAAALQRFLF